MDELVECLLDELEPWSDRPFALFGHSMGALVAFALARRAAVTGRPLPCWLGLSAHPGPRTAEAPPRQHLHRLSPGHLRLALAQLGGSPAGSAADDRVWARLEPLMRTDLVLSETWRPGPGALVVPVPVSAFCGVDDPVAGATTAARWSAYTDRFLGVRAFPGGHFYFRSDPDPVIAQIVADVSAAAGLAAEPCRTAEPCGSPEPCRPPEAGRSAEPCRPAAS